MAASEIQNVVEAFDELYGTERPRYTLKDEERWLFAEKIDKRKSFYDSFNGVGDIVKWYVDAVSHERGGYIPEHLEAPLVERSRAFDLRVLPEISSHISIEQYDRYIGRWNAGDYYFANAYAVPERFRPKRVLDFGAGFGRQVNLWSQEVPELVYTAVDIVRNSYLSQNLYFKRSELPLNEYVIDPSSFTIRNTPGIYHIPSWRWDLVPTGFFDMILAIFVLPEVSVAALTKTLSEFYRVLKPGGGLFIRDHGKMVPSFNGVHVSAELKRLGFVLEFRPYVRGQTRVNEKVDIRGVPRIWRKLDPDIPVAD